MTNIVEKQYKILVKDDRREKVWEGTLEELTSCFSYTLEIGNSHKPSIKREPKTIKSLVSNLQKAFAVEEARCYNRTYIELILK